TPCSPRATPTLPTPKKNSRSTNARNPKSTKLGAAAPAPTSAAPTASRLRRKRRNPICRRYPSPFLRFFFAILQAFKACPFYLQGALLLRPCGVLSGGFLWIERSFLPLLGHCWGFSRWASSEWSNQIHPPSQSPNHRREKADGGCSAPSPTKTSPSSPSS